MSTLLIVVAVYVLATLTALGIVVVQILRMPPGYLVQPPARRTTSWTASRIAMNMVGAVVVVVGVLLSLPGIPGQGLLTILAGVFMMDIPGKERIERRLLANRGVLAKTNRIRTWFGRPPLQPPP